MRQEISAGGVVYKLKNGKPLWLVVQHSQHKGWVFPKGLTTDHDEEPLEETALREVREEGGIKAKIVKKISSPAQYWYVWEREKIKKIVWYFLMKYLSGSERDHDLEVSDSGWFTTEEAEKKLTYPSDKKIFALVKKMIENERLS